jgi:hypothetical protein
VEICGKYCEGYCRHYIYINSVYGMIIVVIYESQSYCHILLICVPDYCVLSCSMIYIFPSLTGSVKILFLKHRDRTYA